MSEQKRRKVPGFGHTPWYSAKVRRIVLTLPEDMTRTLANEAIRRGTPLTFIVREKLALRLADETRQEHEAKQAEREARTAAWFAQPWT